MGDLLIRNISDAMKADLNRLAEITNGNLSEAVKLVLDEGIEPLIKKLEAARSDVPLGDRLKEILSGVFETNEEAETFNRELDQDRKSDFGRPLPDFE